MIYQNGVGGAVRSFESVRVRLRAATAAVVIVLASGVAMGDADAGSPAVTASSPQVKKDSKLEWRFELLPRAFQRNPRVDFNVISEMTDAGRRMPQPSPEQPVYYELELGKAPQLRGDSDGNPKSPDLEYLEQTLSRALADNGLLPGAPPTNPSTVFLACHWGYYSLLDEVPEFATGERVKRRRELLDRASLIGGGKFAIEFAEVLEKSDRYKEAMAAFVNSSSDFPPIMGDMTSGTDFMNPLEMFVRRDSKTRHLFEESIRPCYFVIVSAYDLKSATANKRVLLWRTKMTVTAEGFSMRETLIPLIANTGAYLGTDMSETTTVEKRIDRKGKVEIGPLKVVGYEQSAP